ncbi:class I SAM-dependent methyltransferase [Pseudodesulfovibrio sp. JC047]|uniref:class I SAM-dependent methyltransferase n=1 Tax=Pseudodesulfovibrio sp. JC047 TaxID=2683199 RepID=UPI0013D15252|nr:class I SAM-dependent methyltransferase [Pseudodesulfovibrio sp. JC047]NDV20794.1 class I SAM-dependent methyltransferase [Pseudodesulfovibrio sp. JC047]
MDEPSVSSFSPERRKGYFRKSRRFARAVSTVSHWMGWGGRQLGFYIPYRWAGAVPTVTEDDTYHWLKRSWDDDQSSFSESLERLAPYRDRFRDFSKKNTEDRDCPRFDQSWCPGLDGAAAYAFVRENRPATIIEIGSGHSTRFMARAIADGLLSTRFISIDPQPRRGIDHLCTHIIRQTLDTVDTALFSNLKAGDILYFDGSHIAMPGTDVDTLVNQILPLVASGVWVHFHDIFLPYGYPNIWRWRGYNEQSMVNALLAGGERFHVRFASAYIRRSMADRIAGWPIPVSERAFESSLWLSVA